MSKLKEFLKEHNLESVALIDDAFDRPTIEAVGESQISDFWAAVDDDEELLNLIREIGVKANSADEITDADLSLLWDNRSQFGKSKDQLENTLFLLHTERLDSISGLRDELDLLFERVVTSGLDGNVPENPCRLVFIDYYLGPTTSQESIRNSIETAKKVHAAFSEKGVIPIIVLMSSIKISPDNVRDFRQKSGLLGGMFYFIEKKNLSNRDYLDVNLAAFAKTLPASSGVHDLLKALEDSIPKVTTQFLSEVKAINVDDYTYIQKLKLNDEGHPLGDYILWLFGEFLADLLSKDSGIRSSREKIDRLCFDTLPPSIATPSSNIAKVYQSAIFDLADTSVLAHPLEKEPTPEEAAIDANKVSRPVLHLGDLFINGESLEALLIINPECDLAFTPRGKRKIPNDQSIIFLQGKLQHLDDFSESQTSNKTEFFEYQGTAYRILWDTKRIISHQYCEVIENLNRQGFRKQARMKLPFALELQQAFAASLTRIGMPVPPPLFTKYYAEILGKTASGDIVKLRGIQEVAAISAPMQSKPRNCVITTEFAVSIKRSLDQFFKESRESAGNVTDVSDRNKQFSRLNAVKDLLDGFETAFVNAPQFDIPLKGGTSKIFGKEFIQCSFDGNDKWTNDQKQVMHLKFKSMDDDPNADDSI